MTMANTGTDVMRTEIGKQMLTMMVNTLLLFEWDSAERMSVESLVL